AMNSFISAPTTSSGRPQFSLENANRVSAPMPCSRQKSMHRLTARAPARWPMTRGRPRRAAQRPLPSMMMATCRGRARASGPGGCRSGAAWSGGAWSSVNGVASWGFGRATGRAQDHRPRVTDHVPSDRHQLRFLGLDHLVDVLDRLVGQLLDVVLAAAQVVLGERL